MFITSMLIAGLGGFVGSGCRYLTGVFGKKFCGSRYPWGTFIANVLGCFIIGLFYGLWNRHDMSQLVNATGFCGGYTTFSSFSHDSYQMIVNGQWGKFLLYVVPSVALGLLMVFAGMKCIC